MRTSAVGESIPGTSFFTSQNDHKEPVDFNDARGRFVPQADMINTESSSALGVKDNGPRKGPPRLPFSNQLRRRGHQRHHHRNQASHATNLNLTQNAHEFNNIKTQIQSHQDRGHPQLDKKIKPKRPLRSTREARKVLTRGNSQSDLHHKGRTQD